MYVQFSLLLLYASLLSMPPPACCSSFAAARRRDLHAQVGFLAAAPGTAWMLALLGFLALVCVQTSHALAALLPLLTRELGHKAKHTSAAVTHSWRPFTSTCCVVSSQDGCRAAITGGMQLELIFSLRYLLPCLLRRTSSR